MARDSHAWTTTFSAGQGTLLPELAHHRQCHCDRETGIERFDIVISIVSVSILSEPFLTNPGIAESATCEIAGVKRGEREVLRGMQVKGVGKPQLLIMKPDTQG